MVSEPTSKPVALVTGASWGIGAATATTLADEGYAVVVTDLNRSMLEQTSTALGAKSTDHLALQLDIREQSSIDAALHQVMQSFGRVDLLVNNAGVPLRSNALDVTREDWARVLGVNLEGTFFMSQAVGRLLIQSKRPGSIVSVASTHALVGLASSSTYGIAKAGICQMTRMLAIEWAEHGIRVNAIAPASTLTPTRKGLADPDKRELFLNRIPLGRLGTPEDMASAIAYLASPRASFITGQTLVIDGGLTAS